MGREFVLATLCFSAFATAHSSEIAPIACEGLFEGTPPEDEGPIPSSAEYDAALTALDLEAVKADIIKVMTASKHCWPADFGNYGPFFVRLAWHCSGSYRSTDGKGGCGGGRQRFEPERSWGDNTNLDKARALLAPVKAKYGHGLSWGDLFTLAGTTALRNMGTPIKQFCAGRIDSADGTDSLALGPSAEQEKEAPCPINGKCKRPLGSTTIGLIYLNPEGPVSNVSGVWQPNPDPELSAADVRDSFKRMDHDDRDTVALIGGGHAFGKSHGACPSGPGPSPKEVFSNKSLPQVPWPGTCGTGRGKDTYTSGFEGPWTSQPLKWDNEFFKKLLSEEWEKFKGPGNRWQWRIKGAGTNEEEQLMRLTSDVALIADKAYRQIVEEFAHNMTAFEEAFDLAWNKLITKGGTWSSASRCDSGSFPGHLLADASGMLPSDLMI